MEEDKAPSIAEANNILKIDSGECDFVFYELSDAKYMLNAKGDRGYSKYINFNKKFKNKPNIIVSLKGIDAANDRFIRVNIFAKNISNKGFNLECLTWDDSKTYGIYASWIAMRY
jgi:hypothetical protein